MSNPELTNEEIFQRLLNDQSEDAWWSNIQLLRQRPTQETFDQCVHYLASDNAVARTMAIDVLAQLGSSPRPFYEATVKLIFDLLPEEAEESVIYSALHALGHNNQSFQTEEIKALLPFLDSSSDDIRHALVAALSGVDHDDAIEMLITLSTDPVPETRDWATFGLGTRIERNNERIVEALWQRIDDPSQDTSHEAVVGLARRNDPRVRDVIEKALIDDNYGTLIFDAIELLNDQSLLPYLERSLESVKGDTGINGGWVLALEGCIERLKENVKK